MGIIEKIFERTANRIEANLPGRGLLSAGAGDAEARVRN